ncbi:hypothetical protein H6G89_21580 [Oscillatoria sp. FACHB-1407]|uniref:NB-ARC domain-containing protein n=1 Tax=Oscillatoria sp. FACHB-1407 TaxID=2692847 RepID=UPI001688E8FA|nr:AAA family ATPase [Oscillatoria sp. FACHB-1407]MBD2463597.1 hypothetical protein [Oscillatoria sp. FACHB-1407]
MEEFEPDKSGVIFEKDVLSFIDALIFTTTGRPLSTVEILVLQGSWNHQKYPQIAAQHGYTTDYLKNDIGPQLWKQLSQALNEKVSKTNVRAVLLRRFSSKDLPADTLSNPSIWQSELPPDTAQVPTVPPSLSHNLPPRQTQLIGRQAELMQLLKWLSFDYPIPHMGIVGTGGVGKTTLLVEAAYHCLQTRPGKPFGAWGAIASPFETIVFTSAQVQRFTTSGILPRLRCERTLRDILRTLARTLHCPEVPSTSFAEAYDQILQFLENRRTLLLIDNLDTLEEQQEVFSFIQELPGTVKVLISSRHVVPFPQISLEGLPQTEALQLIQYQAHEKGAQVDLREAHKLYQITGGVPAAIGYAVSQRAMGYSLEEAIPHFQQSTSDFVQFYLSGTIHSLQGKAAGSLLKALALFVKPAVREAVRFVAGIQGAIAAMDGLAQLQKLSLIQQEQGRLTMLPLTRGYVFHELATDFMFEQVARSRWIEWYVNYAQTHGGKDWREWQDYQALEQEWENLTEVIEWCIEHNRYEEVCQLWRLLKCYTYSQGYRQSRLTCWDSPLNWLNWLIPEAQTRQDWATTAEMLGDRAWKLTLMGQPQHLTAAGILFPQAWELRHYQTVQWQIELAIYTAAWHLQQDHFVLASQWLQQAQALLEQAQFGSSFTSRHSLLVRYYQGEISYKTNQYEAGETLFSQIAEQAQAIGWQRAVFLAKDFLADIAIQQGQLDKAQQLLIEGLQVAEAHSDFCSQAYTKRSLGQLERQRGHLSTAHRWVSEAKAEFERLGMLPEAKETQTLLQLVVSND